MLKISVVLSFIVIFISCNHPVNNSPDGTESNLTILTYGFSSSSQAQSITAKKYGFQYRAVAGCIVEEELVDSVHQHNKIVYSILEKKHGKNWKQKFNKDVEATYLITSLNPLYTNLAAQCKTCPIAKQLAGNDFNKGKYLIVAWGLIDSESPTLRIARTLEKDYKIKTVFGGCVRKDEIECYDSQMRKLLDSKYGNTFYKNAYREAITL